MMALLSKMLYGYVKNFHEILHAHDIFHLFLVELVTMFSCSVALVASILTASQKAVYEFRLLTSSCPLAAVTWAEFLSVVAVWLAT
jgi:hypothetical protein